MYVVIRKFRELRCIFVCLRKYTIALGITINHLNAPENWIYFTVVNGKVNNLGLIIWTIPEYGNWIVNYSDDYESVKTKSSEKYLNTEWNEIDRINRGFPIDRSDQENPMMQEYIVRGDDEARYQELWIFWHLGIAQE